MYSGSAVTGMAEAASIFTTQTAINGTIPGIVNMLQSGQALTGLTYSASFLAAPSAPEPSTLSLLSIGLIGASLILRKQFRG